jgi:hypothetical protein
MNVSVTVDSLAFDSPAAFANWVRSQLAVMVTVNRVLIRKKLVGPLYQSGVTFRKEPDGVETFVDALTCRRVGCGDCAHLACWRCAELQDSGESATLRIKWNHPIYHVQVRRADGRIEDPSRNLGMLGL